MPIEAVVGNIDFPADKPLRMWRLPLQNVVPPLEPMQFALSKPRPESFRIGGRFGAQRFQLGHRLDVGFFGEGAGRIEDAALGLK